MGDYPHHMRQSDGTTLFPGERPRVQLPRPVVNLPSSSGSTRPFQADSHYAAAAAPRVESLNNQYPYPVAPSPQVNMPLYAQRQVQYPLNESQQSAADSIENRMRGMILRNEIPQGHVTHQETWGQGQIPDQPHFRRPNQAQRRSNNAQTNQQMAQNQSILRSPAPQRQLYNPNAGQTRQNNSLQGYNPRLNLQDQIAYLDTLAIHEIPKIEISREEYDQKHALRLSLEATCREVVTAYEIEKDANFKADTVELKCFGSLSTTFATKSSDMDLVLVSPQSKPVLSSPDSEIPRLVERALLDSEYGARLLTKTRVPIIRFCERPAPELANLLKEERLKWEMEMNAGATQLKAKKNSGKKKVDSRSSEPTKGEDASKVVSLSGTGPMDKPDEELIGLFKLAMQEGWYEPSERNFINTFIKTTQNGKSSEQDKIRARSQLHDLPNIIGRYRAPPEAHRLEFPKDGVGIQCDINFSNLLALHNSHLLRCYSLCDARVRRMVLFVKAWSKKRKVNSPYHGTLSSYGYVLMVLHYLVNIAQPPVVPNLQTVSQAFEDQLSMKEAVLDGYNILFFRNETAIEELRRRKSITSNIESLGSLLRGFFHYYAQTGYNSPAGGFQWTQDTLSLRTVGGILSKQSKGWTGAKTEKVDMSGPGTHQTKEIRQRYLFAIEDPFEIEHNIARTVVHNGIVAIRDEFRRAHRLIENGGMVPGKRAEGFFTEAEDKENLQYRAFGPRPRRVPGPSKETTRAENAANVPSGTGSAQGLGSQGR